MYEDVSHTGMYIRINTYIYSVKVKAMIIIVEGGINFTKKLHISRRK